MLSGQTRGEAARAIEAALSSYYSNLSAEVSVTKYTANRVLLLGAVSHPGMITFDGTPTLLEALSRGASRPGQITEPQQRPPSPHRFPSVALFIADATRWCGWS